MLSLHSGYNVPNFGDRPAPDTPLLASMQIPDGSINRSLNRGANARIAVLV